MTKRLTTLATIVAAIGILAPAAAFAKTMAGRVTSFSPTVLSIFDKEIVTVGLTDKTAFTKLIVQKPWQEDAAVTATALRVGRYVVVHAENGVASWVQVATDRVFAEPAFTAFAAPVVIAPALMTEAGRHRAEAAALRAAPNASESKRPGSPGTALHCERIANRLDKAAGFTGTPAPGAALANDVLGSKDERELIARYEAEAAHHAAEANTYRKAPNASESKRPGSPDTAAHCDRLAAAARDAASERENLAK